MNLRRPSKGNPRAVVIEATTILLEKRTLKSLDVLAVTDDGVLEVLHLHP